MPKKVNVDLLIEIFGEETWESLRYTPQFYIRKISDPQKIQKSYDGNIIIGNSEYDPEQAARIVSNSMCRLCRKDENEKREKYYWNEVVGEIEDFKGNRYKKRKGKTQEKDKMDKPFIDLFGKSVWEELRDKSYIRKISDPEKIEKTANGEIIFFSFLIFIFPAQTTHRV